jgi:hypothetical protein
MLSYSYSSINKTPFGKDVDKPPQLAAQHQSRHMAKKIKL